MITKFKIPLVVFLTGACSLVIEIAAMRILSPYFGNTIFTTSSVISVVLGALSLGYYFGGKLSERHSHHQLFFLLIALAGISTIFIQIAGGVLLPTLSSKLGIITGPLILSILLFFMPSVLLGAVSPLAIKLQGALNPKKGAGAIAGEIFFWSTAGSIVGSLLAGFALIPTLGVSKIVILTGAGLFLLGGTPLVKSKKFVALMFFGAIILVAGWSTENRNAIYDRDGIYGRITIFDSSSEKGPVRYLIQDKNSNSGMFLNSDDLVFEYTKYYSLYRLFKPDAKRALFLGGGAYSMPKTLLAELPDINIDVVEIEPQLPELAKAYFRLPRNPRLQNHVSDGRRFLIISPTKYDLIFGDVYQSLHSIPAHMTTAEFFELVRSRLTNGGVFIANVIGNLSPTYPSFTLSEIKTFKQVFPNSSFLAVQSPDSSKAQNLIFLGVNGDSNQKLNMEDKIIDIGRYNLQHYPVLTDDYSPVEYLAAKMLAN